MSKKNKTQELMLERAIENNIVHNVKPFKRK